MIKKKFIGIIILFFSLNLCAQKRYFTKTGNITFHAGTALEDIDAVNKSGSSVFDATTGHIEFAVLIKGFEFKRALMQDHFNENYLESEKYPKAVFIGKIVNIAEVNFLKDGTYPLTIKGTLEMHGVKNDIEAPAKLQVAGEMIDADANFTAALSDYKITIPGLVRDKISKTVTIKITCNYHALK